MYIFGYWVRMLRLSGEYGVVILRCGIWLMRCQVGMVGHGWKLRAMASHGQKLGAMASHGRKLRAMANHGQKLRAMASHGRKLWAMAGLRFKLEFKFTRIRLSRTCRCLRCCRQSFFFDITLIVLQT